MTLLKGGAILLVAGLYNVINELSGFIPHNNKVLTVNVNLLNFNWLESVLYSIAV